MGDCAEPRPRDRQAVLQDLLLQALETDRRTSEILQSTAATLERLRVLQELKRRGRV
jgi:hypothetical protein